MTPLILGLVRVWAEPAVLVPGPAELLLVNPHRSRSVLRLDEVELGQVDPRGEVVITGVREGEWQVTWITPRGFERPTVATARLPAPPSRSSGR